MFDIYNLMRYEDGVNTNFILIDNSQFLTTDYKVMKGQLNGGLVRCEKVLFNGHVKLLYLTENYTKLENLLPVLEEKNFLTVLSGILKIFIEIKENGFLDYHRLVLSPEYIFVEMNTMKVYMVYLPVERRVSGIQIQTNEIRHVLINILSEGVRLKSSLVHRLTMMISEESMTLQEIHKELVNQWGIAEEEEEKEDEVELPKERILNLISINPEFPVRFRIDKRDFLIGRENGKVDGVIIGSPVVGRQHCKVIYKEEKYYIEDNASRNGTFLNGDKLSKGNPKEIAERSFIRIANVTFKVIYD